MAYISALAQASAQLSVTYAGAGLNVIGNSQALTSPSGGFNRTLTLTLGTGATALYVDTLHNSVRSIAASGSDTLTLSALVGTSSPTAMYDILNQATPVFARVRAMLIELLYTGDTVGPSDPTPTAASSVTVGNAASAKWTAILLTTSTISIASACSAAFVSRSAAGFAVAAASSDQLKILNADASLAAIYRIVIFGGST